MLQTEDFPPEPEGSREPEVYYPPDESKLSPKPNKRRRYPLLVECIRWLFTLFIYVLIYEFTDTLLEKMFVFYGALFTFILLGYFDDYLIKTRWKRILICLLFSGLAVWKVVPMIEAKYEKEHPAPPKYPNATRNDVTSLKEEVHNQLESVRLALLSKEDKPYTFKPADFDFQINKRQMPIFDRAHIDAPFPSVPSLSIILTNKSPTTLSKFTLDVRVVGCTLSSSSPFWQKGTPADGYDHLASERGIPGFSKFDEILPAIAQPYPDIDLRCPDGQNPKAFIIVMAGEGKGFIYGTVFKE